MMDAIFKTAVMVLIVIAAYKIGKDTAYAEMEGVDDDYEYDE